MSAGTLPRNPSPPRPELEPGDRMDGNNRPGDDFAGDPMPGGIPDDNDIQSIFDKYAGQQLTPELMQELAYDLMKFDMMSQMGQAQYKQDYLDYLDKQLDLSNDELDLARQQLEWKEGPYWEWYTTEYMDSVMEMNRNEVEKSNLSVDQAEQYSKGALFNALGSFYNAQRSEYELSRQMAQDPRGIRQSGMDSYARAGY